MAMEWTREQKQVIEGRNRNLLVSAAAGSGKTAVLVERIIRMILDEEHPVDIDRLLVMTFTKAAASEMRERIQAAIEKQVEKQPENIHLQQQAVMAQYAQITTIDSFCLHIIKEHFDRLDIDPAFKVADEGEMLLLKSDVLRQLLEDYYDVGGVFEDFVDTYAIGKTDGGIADYIEQVYSFAQSNPWPSEWIAQCREELSEGTIAHFDKLPWMQFLLADVRLQAKEWEAQLSSAIRVCEEEDGPEPYLPMLCQDLDGIRGLTGAVTYEALEEAAARITFPRLAAVRGKNSPVNPDKKEQVADLRKRIKSAVEKLKEQYLYDSGEQIAADMAHSKNAVLMLLELTEAYMKRLREKKREKNLIDFNDMEHFALDILLEETEEGKKPGAVADEISSQFDEILVDEYQDSNMVQETLINSISRERFGHPNVFMVGDVKQSIYKFRLAKPELFLEKYHAYSREDSSYQMIELHQNFRSRPLVLESINEVFDRIMAENLGGIEYTQETALHPGAWFEERGDLSELRTELLLLNTAGSALENLDEDLSDYTTRELEAAVIASKIHEMTDPDHGLTVWDKETECYRRVQYGDIVILLRSVSGFAETFTAVLGRQGIPAFAESRTGYFDTPEVNTVLHFLSLLDNPIQDIPLAAVLKAPFFQVTDEELAHVTALYKSSAEKGRDKGLYYAVTSFIEDMTAASDDREGPLLTKLSSAVRLLSELREEALYLPLHRLLYRIFDRTGYYNYVSAMPAGEVRQANLDMLVEKAESYENTSYKGVFHFIRYIEKLRRYNTDFGEASVVNGQGNTVRIMSIHKSKGLEFPVVILAGMGKLFNRQDARGKILIDPDFGIGTDYLDGEKHLKGPTLKKNAMKRRMELDALGEELRVLYVAMTRAKEKLVMTAADRSLETKLEKWRNLPDTAGKLPFTILSLANSYLDWILMSISGGSAHIDVKIIEAESLLNTEIENQLSAELTGRQLLNIDTNTVYDEAYREKLLHSFQFVYPYETDVILNTKMSVSELKKAGDQTLEDEEESAVLQELVPTIPSFMKEEIEEKSGVTRGTAYHRAMELLDFGSIKTAEDVKLQLASLTESGRLTKEAEALIRPADISRFLQTDLGKRTAAAQQAGRLYRERQFVMGVPARETGSWDSDEPVLIQGIIDAYLEEEDGIVLIDYKTDYAENPGELINRYKTQLAYYERAIVQILHKPVKERYIYSYRLGSIRV